MAYKSTRYSLIESEEFAMASETLSYRPRFLKPAELKKLISKLGYNTNNFIEEAVTEKIMREKFGARQHQDLAEAILKVVHKRFGWDIAIPSAKENKRIEKSIKKLKSRKSRYVEWKGKL